MSRKRSRGHGCWACGRHLPNERFSGRGHARHLCRACARRPDLEVLQAVRNVERIVLGPGKLRRKLVHLRPYLEHEDERIRTAARGLLDFWDPPFPPEDEPEEEPEVERVEGPWDPEVPPWDDEPPG